MGTPLLRLRLVFEDRSILSKTQRSDGMYHSWFLLKSQQYPTISDICNHLLNIFKLHRSCPNGILLSMEAFALPPFESTEILKDGEIISVKKKGGTTLEAANGGNLLDEAEGDELELRDNGLLLLANDKLDKVIGESDSESEDVDEEQSQDEEELPGEAVSKKRNAFVKLQKSKKKKQCLGVLDDDEDEIETEELENVVSKKEKKQNCNRKLKSPSVVKRSEELQENVEKINQVSTAPGTKKMPSRSARRKKAKRQWMRELAKIAKKKPQPYSKPELTKAENKETNGQPRGLLHWKQASKKPVQNGNMGTDAVPVVTRPGHIRFEPLDKDQTPKRIGVSYETLKWNSSSSKKRGQKSGREKFLISQRNDAKRINKESFKMLFKDSQVPVIDTNDFDKLPPCSEPKEGDVIAYRLLELNSSWIPEFSSFRVGRISYYDARDIVLIPVPEYPINLDNIDDNGPNESLYEKDGTLEINYSALVDVRNVKQYDPEATEPVSDGANRSTVSDDKDPWNRLSNLTSKNTETSILLSGLNPCSSGVTVSPSAGPDTNKPESSREKQGQNGSSLDPWLNANNPDPSQENNNTGWTSVKTIMPSENDCETGSSWGRPWSSFVPLRGSSSKQPNNKNDRIAGSSRGNGNPWPRGGPRGRGFGRGRGRGRGRNGKMM